MNTKDKLEKLKDAADAAESVYADAVDSHADRETWDAAYNAAAYADRCADYITKEREIK